MTGALIGALIYDDAGNLVQKCEGGTVTATATSCTGSSVLALQYNADNRIAQASGNGVSETYGYDDQGRRIRKTSNGSTTWYLYNGPDIVAEYEGDWTKPKVMVTHGPGTDDPVVRYTRNAGGTYDKRYYHQDPQNSSVAVTDANGTLVGTQLFDAWGNKLPSGTLGSVERYGYTGREPDATGLIYYRARYYDPGVARFTQRDPIGLQGGMNQYAYVGNSPVNYSDPTGLFRVDPFSTNTATAYADLFSLNLAGIGGGGQSASSASGIDWSQGVQVACGFLCPTIGIITSSSGAGVGAAINSGKQGFNSLSSGGGSGDLAPFVQGSGNSSPGSPDPMCGLFGIGCNNNQSPSTKADSGALGKNLVNSGWEPRPGEEAHHIVAGRAGGAAPARGVLENFGIDINSAENGAWLQGPKGTGDLFAPPHRTQGTAIHTPDYYRAVNETMLRATSRQEALEALQSIRSGLLNGTFPPK